jgi:hypothetical protein
MVVKSVGVLSVGKVFACLYALLGLIVGAIFSLLALASALAGAAAGGAPPEAQLSGVVALLLGAGAIIIMPILYGLGGFVGGMIAALLYNVVAAIAGGIEIELTERAPASGPG